jgi:hypothetical protein
MLLHELLRHVLYSYFIIITLKPCGKYVHRLLYQSSNVHFLYTIVVLFSILTAIISLKRISLLVFLMKKLRVLFEVRTEFLNIIYRIFGFKFVFCNECMGSLQNFLLLRRDSHVDCITQR